MTPPADPSPGRAPDDLHLIHGLAPWIADILREAGVGVAALADVSPADLAELLRQRVATEIAIERIERDDWIGQARALAASSGGGSRAAHQEAGFSLFVDRLPDEHGHDSWQTRIYHEESGCEIAFAGIEPTRWWEWILAKSLPVAVARARRSAGTGLGADAEVRVVRASAAPLPHGTEGHRIQICLELRARQDR